MFEHKKIRKLEDYFSGLSARKESGVYFYRINGYNAEISDFLQKYFEKARNSGVVIEGKLPNPDEKNLSYYNEIMGTDFKMSTDFIIISLRKWMPRMNEYQRKNLSLSVYDNLDAMRKAGKNENMLKNAYIKFMCWLYYKFERIANRFGENDLPKILYEGEISKYELMMLSILSNTGCDVVLLQYHGDDCYRKSDPGSVYSDELQLPDMRSFPADFSLKQMRGEIQKKLQQERLYGEKPSFLNCTNAWITGEGLNDIKKSTGERGNDPKLFYNCFIRICGVEDKLTYTNELYQFYLELKNRKRKILVAENEIPRPSMEEINAIRRKNYAGQDQMLLDISSNIQCVVNPQLQRLMRKAFLEVMTEASKMPGMNLNKLTNKAVYLLCWLKRYQPVLFANWKPSDVACFIYMNGCRNENEALFLKLLAKLPVDVLILNPDKKKDDCLLDPVLYEINHMESLMLQKFPVEGSQVQMGTAAYHAERELDVLMYQDSGIYRNRQFQKANALSLQTTYEEIAILWDQELPYRPNFGTAEGEVAIPVIFAKVSGIKDGDVSSYWSKIKALLTKDTLFIRTVPYLQSTEENPIKAYVTEFFKNGKLLKDKIKAHKYYPYGFLREEMQEHILDKLALLIRQKTIKGTFLNGMEYTIISTVLNLRKEITRLLQNFDFTKKNPKLIFIHTTEAMFSQEDAILAAFLNLAGFDVLVFTPTGYQGLEKFYNQKMMEEHQIGEYIYDLAIPDFGKVSSGTRQSWRDKIFKRGR